MQTFYKNAMRAIITIATALFLTSLAMLRAFAQDLPPNGPFFGGYEVKTGSPDIDISLDIDQLSGEDTGWGTINLFSKKVKPRCPENMADSFCRELGNRFANLGAEPKALDTERDGMLIMKDDDRMELREGEVLQDRLVRFRTLGCYPLTGAIESEADTLEAIIQEMLVSTTSERQGRVIDHDPSASMEKKKQEGYF